MIVLANHIPYVKTSEHTIKINGDTFIRAAKNLHEPGWDICFHIVNKQNGPYLSYLIIDDAAYMYRWDKRNLTTIIIKPHPNAEQLINDFKEFMSREDT